MKSLIKSLFIAVLLFSVSFVAGCAFDDAYVGPSVVYGQTVIYRTGYGYGYWNSGTWCPYRRRYTPSYGHSYGGYHRYNGGFNGSYNGGFRGSFRGRR